MKKLLAIILLAIYLFNLGGYSVAFRYLISRSESILAAQIDENKYDDAQLVEITIPLNLPYMQNSGGFERVDGSVEKNGVKYKYVKRRIENDTLYILCLPNRDRTKLIKEKSRYSAEVNDFATTPKEKKSTTKKTVNSSEYNDNNDLAQHISRMSNPTVVIPNPFFAVHLSSLAIDKPERPPQAS